MAILLTLGLVSIWFDDPTRLATALDLITADLLTVLARMMQSRCTEIPVVDRGEPPKVSWGSCIRPTSLATYHRHLLSGDERRETVQPI